jgi:hypothetical protein
MPLIGQETIRLGESAPKLGEYGSIVNATTILQYSEQSEGMVNNQVCNE